MPETETLETYFQTRSVEAKKDRKSLVMPFLLYHGEGKTSTLYALIDTGCEVNLVGKGLVHPNCFITSPNRVRLVTANGKLLGGLIK